MYFIIIPDCVFFASPRGQFSWCSRRGQISARILRSLAALHNSIIVKPDSTPKQHDVPVRTRRGPWHARSDLPDLLLYEFPICIPTTPLSPAPFSNRLFSAHRVWNICLNAINSFGLLAIKSVLDASATPQKDLIASQCARRTFLICSSFRTKHPNIHKCKSAASTIYIYIYLLYTFAHFQSS